MKFSDDTAILGPTGVMSSDAQCGEDRGDGF